MNQCRKPTLADRPWIQRIYESSGYRGAEYTFANLYLWSFYYGEVAEVEGYLCQRLNFRGVHQYLYPAGSGDIRPVLERIFADSRREGKPLVIRSLTRETMAQLESLYPGQFTYEPDRDSYDYLYEIGTLADLPGRKLQSKRNHINRFIEACHHAPQPPRLRKAGGKVVREPPRVRRGPPGADQGAGAL